MKKLKISIFILTGFILLINLQSCAWFLGAEPYCKQFGYITDTNGVGIPNVKLTVIETEDFNSWNETNLIYYSTNTGYYEILFNYDIKKYYKVKLTHDEYIYVIKPGQSYPLIIKGIEVDTNLAMVKKGKVKIKGEAVCPDYSDYWLPNVRISLLKRLNGSTDYPDTTDIYTYTDKNGHYYIEFDGDENYEFSLKPEKEGYFYNYGGIFPDCIIVDNIDPGYIIGISFEMKQED